MYAFNSGNVLSMQLHVDAIVSVNSFIKVVSASTDSLISVWNIMSGEKDMQFFAHRYFQKGETVNIEITALSFDPTYRRLITAARDGKAGCL